MCKFDNINFSCYKGISISHIGSQCYNISCAFQRDCWECIMKYYEENLNEALSMAILMNLDVTLTRPMVIQDIKFIEYLEKNPTYEWFVLDKNKLFLEGTRWKNKKFLYWVRSYFDEVKCGFWKNYNIEQI